MRKRLSRLYRRFVDLIP